MTALSPAILTASHRAHRQTTAFFTISKVSLAFSSRMASTTAAAMKPAAALLPTLFLSHGGGPCFFMDTPKGHPFEEIGSTSKPAAFFREFQKNPAVAPWWPSVKAMIVISAHWEESDVTVQTAAKPTMYYDYYGFPKETYQLKWDAPGSPDLAKKVQGLLEGIGLPVGTDNKRGFDHGVFVPLKLVVPDASIPTIQLSLHSSLDPAMHLKIGAALAPLRGQGVLIVGSGYATHNLGEMRMGGGQGPPATWVKEFAAWLDETMMAVQPDERVKRLATVTKIAPHFRRAHPREEHFIPLHVAVGAAAPEAVQAVLGKGKGNATAAADVAADGTASTAAAHPTTQLWSSINLGSGLLACYMMQ